jgi:DNA-binding response OmpR family regulator
MSEPIRVILVEDDPTLAGSLASYLELVGYAVTVVGDSLSYYGKLGQGRFAVAVIDLILPDQDGEVLVEYTRKNTNCAIVVITARDTLESRIQCYQTGADVFLGKPVNGRELAAVIGNLAARHGEPEAQPPHTRPASGRWRLLKQQRAIMCPDGAVLSLTAREYCLLDKLAASHGEPVFRAEILDLLYRRRDASAQRALETLVRRTRQKIAQRYPDQCSILTHHGIGYALAISLQAE